MPPNNVDDDEGKLKSFEISEFGYLDRIFNSLKKLVGTM